MRDVLDCYRQCVVLVVSPRETAASLEINTGIISWESKPDVHQSAANFDWGNPLADLTTKTDDLDLKWSDDEGEKDSEGSDEGIRMKCDSIEDEEEDTAESPHQHIDIMAQQLKFVACLKILMEELSTLATGFEVDGKDVAVAKRTVFMNLSLQVDSCDISCTYG